MHTILSGPCPPIGGFVDFFLFDRTWKIVAGVSRHRLFASAFMTWCRKACRGARWLLTNDGGLVSCNGNSCAHADRVNK